MINTITGQNAPAGRLPITEYPQSYVDAVPMTDMGLRPNSSSGNPGRTYRWFDSPVLPFGYGLHYTNFSASISSPNETTEFSTSDLVANCGNSSTPLDLCPFMSVPVSISNEGSVTSDYVTLGFLTGEYGPQPYPLKTLVAYERLFNVSASESQTATLNLTLGSLSRYDDMGNQILFPSEYALVIDTDSRAVWNFTVTGDEQTLDEWPQPREGRGVVGHLNSQ